MSALAWLLFALAAAAPLMAAPAGAQEPPARSASPDLLPPRRTAPTVRFFAMGDGGTGGPAQYEVAAAIDKKCEMSGCDFGILLGDNIYPDGVTALDDPQWKTKFEMPYAALLAKGIPFYAILGNHDYADGRDLARGAFQVAYSSVNDKWRMPAEHFVFEQGPVLFIALDTPKIIANVRASVAGQRQMIETSVAANTRPWMIGLGHHPHFSNGQNGNAGRLLTSFIEERLCRTADLYLAGHDHNIQVLESPPRSPCKALMVVAGGGGYPTYPLPGSNRAVFQAQSLGFVYVSVEPERLALEVLGKDGATLFSREIVK